MSRQSGLSAVMRCNKPDCVMSAVIMKNKVYQRSFNLKFFNGFRKILGFITWFFLHEVHKKLRQLFIDFTMKKMLVQK